MRGSYEIQDPKEREAAAKIRLVWVVIYEIASTYNFKLKSRLSKNNHIKD